MPSNTRRNSTASATSTASYHEYDSEYEPSVVSEHDDDREWNDACLDDEVVATGVIKGSDNIAASTRSKTHTESGSRRSERLRNKTIARIMFETQVGPRLRIRNTRK